MNTRKYYTTTGALQYRIVIIWCNKSLKSLIHQHQIIHCKGEKAIQCNNNNNNDVTSTTDKNKKIFAMNFLSQTMNVVELDFIIKIIKTLLSLIIIGQFSLSMLTIVTNSY